MFIFKWKSCIQEILSLNQKFNNIPILKKNSILRNNKGMAVLETVPLLVVFMVLMTYAMGFWGSIHSGILSSISARTYAFETFRNRSNLLQFRETSTGDYYKNRSFRLHSIISVEAGKRNEESHIAPRMPISFSNFQIKTDLEQQDETKHLAVTEPNNGRSISSETVGTGVSPIWIQIGYGYCLDLECKERK